MVLLGDDWFINLNRLEGAAIVKGTGDKDLILLWTSKKELEFEVDSDKSEKVLSDIASKVDGSIYNMEEATKSDTY